MANANDMRWFKQTFKDRIEPVLQAHPFTLDMLTALACQPPVAIATLRRSQMKPVILLLIALLSAVSVQAQDNDHEGRIRKIIQEQESGWNASNARRYCARLQRDATLTSFTGSIYEGRAAIEERMSDLFANFFKGTRIVMKVRALRFVGSGVAIVEVDTELNAVKTLPPGIRGSADGKLRTRLLEIMVYEGNTWSVVALHNVDVKSP
jgi:uncharacterized protein (TIGR02246 family)